MASGSARKSAFARRSTGTKQELVILYAHDEAEFLSIESGRAEVGLEGSPPLVLEPSDHVWFPGGTPHRLRAVGRGGFAMYSRKKSLVSLRRLSECNERPCL